ncbi:uncharacterized protein J4E79_003387 [Alternaria viburni]|uniref:uncharacterized protein n=1 Tax=Alternaria viburni TaxID=566460 RepID=UPI0020C550FA|nr:uncharacterized protein J4E79_003387 [Alternaria viburni]KAI4665087.1 hypothetical protein J4E79_003387 [Alternaria viburni]
MPPKQMTGKGRTLNEPSFASSTISAFTSKDNRSIVTAAGMFASTIQKENRGKGKANDRV